MTTAGSIRITVFLGWAAITMAGFDIARWHDLVVNGWPALASILAVMIGGKTFEHVQRHATPPAAPAAEEPAG